MEKSLESSLKIERSLVGHFIGEIPSDFDKPVAYVLQRDGLWERRTNSLGTFCRHMAEAHIPGLPAFLEESCELNVPRMPTSILWETIAFFRKVYFSLGTESIVRVIYDKRRQNYSTECPKQMVSPTRVSFEKAPLPRYKILVAEIHSHAGFSADFSGTDDEDELGDRFYGVVGCLREAMPDISFRMSVGGDKMRVPLGSLFALEDDPMFSCSFPRRWMDQVFTRPSGPGGNHDEQLKFLTEEEQERVRILIEEGEE